MKNIIWSNLFQNIIRCVFAYPILLILFALSFPLNMILWFGFFVEFIANCLVFIFRGDTKSLSSNIFFDINDIMFMFFPATMILMDYHKEFINTLKPIKRA